MIKNMLMIIIFMLILLRHRIVQETLKLKTYKIIPTYVSVKKSGHGKEAEKVI